MKYEFNHLTNDLLISTLLEVGFNRPKHPLLNFKQSAIIFCAFYLLISNPLISDKRKKFYKYKFDKFKNECRSKEILINEKYKSKLNPYIIFKKINTNNGDGNDLCSCSTLTLSSSDSVTTTSDNINDKSK